MDLAIQMTGLTGAQGRAGDSNAGVALCNFGLLVVVAPIAGVLGIRARVAGLAGHLASGDAMIERETMRL